MNIASKCQIPKIIHQTYSASVLPSDLELIVNELKLKNPDWEYRFYNNQQREDYIMINYGKNILDTYKLINPIYGAARADFFRYLLLYKEGGVYLDIKSSCMLPLSEVIMDDDEFLLSSWPNRKGEEFENAGIKKELQHVKNGEYQQWYIICKPNHPFLEQVINKVIENIKNYNPWRYGLAKAGVLRVTGPIPYTLAIHPLKSKNSYRYARTHEIFSLKYTMLKNHEDHVKIMKNHYSRVYQPIISPQNGTDYFFYITYVIFWFTIIIPIQIFKLIFNKIYFFIR